jgi:hypothetical protein
VYEGFQTIPEQYELTFKYVKINNLIPNIIADEALEESLTKYELMRENVCR